MRRVSRWVTGLAFVACMLATIIYGGTTMIQVSVILLGLWLIVMILTYRDKPQCC